MTAPWWQIAFEVGRLRLDVDIDLMRRGGHDVAPAEADQRADECWDRLMRLVSSSV